MKLIILKTRERCRVDNEDFFYLNQWKWSCKKNKHTKYAYRRVCIGNGKSIHIWMHREILGISGNKKLRGDHKDHNGLNNQRKNIRIATHAQNNCYKRSAKNSTSKYLGVSFCKQTKRWAATIYKNYKQKRLGRFDTQKEAALAYNKAAKILHGEFANLNIIK